jgi:hypothetical protein
MKTPLFALAAILFSTAILIGGDFDTNLRDLETLQTPKLPAEELKQLRFSWNFERTNMNLPGLKVELHNPFRDKSLRGIVVSLQIKSADGQEETIEAFCDLSCGPLQSAWSYIDLFKAEELAKLSPVVKLTEVHREAVAEPQPAAGQDIEILRTPTFSPEEMKQILFISRFWENPSPPSFGVELHNPFRDKRIRGIVVRVQYKTRDGKDQSVEVFEDLECRPLRNASCGLSFFNESEIVKGSPVITLKEAHYGW